MIDHHEQDLTSARPGTFDLLHTFLFLVKDYVVIVHLVEASTKVSAHYALHFAVVEECLIL